MKKFLTWLFEDFLYQLYDMAEQKFTLHGVTLVVTKTFTPSTIPVGGISVMELTFFKSPIGENPFTFNDAYPIGLVNANPLGLIDGVGGVIAVPGGNSIGTTTGVLIADTLASVKVNVTASAVGTYNNPIPFTLNPILFATLTVIASTKKKRNAFGVPLCFDASTFPNGVCPETFLYKGNSFYRGIQLYRIGNTCCYTSTQPKK